MKPKKWIKRTFIVLVLLAVIPDHVSLAETNIEDLEPNQYKEEEVDLNTNDLHNDSLNQQTYSIPEEQKLLDFLKGQHNPLKEVKSQLFQGGAQKKNTIKAKSSRLELFSQDTQQSAAGHLNQAETKGDSSHLTLLFLLLIGIGILLLFILLIPKVTPKPVKDKISD